MTRGKERRRARTARSRDIASRRARTAAVVIVLAAAVLVASAAAGWLGRPSVASEVMALADAWGDGGDERAVAAASGTELPDGFEEEVVSTSGASDVRSDEEARVAGFLLAGDAGTVFAELSDDMQQRGWAAVESGRAGCGSFVKDEGRYRWAFVSCTPVGDETAVVVTYAVK